MPDENHFFSQISQRYSGVTPEAVMAVLCPLLVRIDTLDKNIIKIPGQSHYRATFTLRLNDENKSVVQVGRTGKFLPRNFGAGGPWREIAKGRIIEVDYVTDIATGEVYTGGGRAKLAKALVELNGHNQMEIDQYGAAAKILSGLAEYYLASSAIAQGYEVMRMPEDMAKHLGAYANFDFLFRKDGVERKVEAKSLWGTNTEHARLIHSKTTRPEGDPATWTASQASNYYQTSSCKFLTQDIFAVSLFLRTGNIQDFAFARSVPRDIHQSGLPRSSSFTEHVHQNPLCQIGDGSWFSSIDDVWQNTP